jgi:hypothetical protein
MAEKSRAAENLLAMQEAKSGLACKRCDDPT